VGVGVGTGTVVGGGGTTWSWWWVVEKQTKRACSRVRGVSVLSRDSGISWDGLFDLGLSRGVAEDVACCKLLGA